MKGVGTDLSEQASQVTAFEAKRTENKQSSAMQNARCQHGPGLGDQGVSTFEDLVHNYGITIAMHMSNCPQDVQGMKSLKVSEGDVGIASIASDIA